MRNFVLKLYAGMQVWRGFLQDDDGQDVVEYALGIGLIALGATVAMQGLATTIGTAFTNVGTKVSTYTS